MSAPARNPSVRQEPDRIRTLAVTLTLLAATTVAAAGVLWAWLELRADRGRPPEGVAQVERVPQAPPAIGGVRQTLIGADAARMAAQQRSMLERYGWVDPAGGIARIPIERAMRIVIERERR